MEMIIWALLFWNLLGFCVYSGISIEANRYTHREYYFLNPIDIYDKWNVNYFGCVLLTIIFNLMCPIMTIGYWFFKFMKFVCTVGRR